MGSEKPRRRRKGDDIKHTLAVTVLVLSLIAAAGGEERPSGRKRYVPGQIIIKLRGSAVLKSDANDSDETETVSRFLSGKAAAGAGWRVQGIRPLIDRSLRLGRGRPAESRLRQIIRERRQPQGRAARDLSRIYQVNISSVDPNRLDTVLRVCRELPEVEYAELNPVVSACLTPNDPLLASQWAIDKIQAAAAWDTCTGTIAPIVAIVDTGVDLTHRDLQGNLWINEAERNGAAGVDDDENGYIDDIHGYNFVYRTNDPQDDAGHGTAVAGVIAAAGNNGVDITGVCWRARIMPLKMLDAEGNGDTAAAAAAIYYAVANGADVINASWGGPDSSQLFADAIAYAEEQGVIVVAAAGNDDSETPFYPAYYSTVIAVAATDSADRRAYFSSYGDWVDVAAPGVNILSLRATGLSTFTPNDAFTTTVSGTSIAAPHVAGTCALLLAADPFLTCAQVRQIITTAGDPISGGIVSSNRRLNAGAAMRQTVAKKGVLYFDRSAYALGRDMNLLLVDRDLTGRTTQTVTVRADGGDVESVVLTQTPWAKGVFAGTIAGRDAEAAPANGSLEVRDGGQVTASYTDADDGAGHTGLKITAQAVADYRAPALVRVEAGIRSSAVRLTIVAGEPARAEVRYHRRGDASAIWIARGDELSDHHEILLSPLPRQTDYQFTVHLSDAAGNETTDANGGGEYTFATAAASADLRVPSVYPTIQAALNAAWVGDTIRVADGTYRGAGNTGLDFMGKALTLRSENGPAACLIDCNGLTGGFYFHSGEDAHSVVDGFTIANAGNTRMGGGILCVASSPTLRNCVLRANNASVYGGGICNTYGSSPLISRCTFQDNSALAETIGFWGGAIANRFASHPVISDCTFFGNKANYGGAIVNTDDCRPQIIRCVFQNNKGLLEGGAVASTKGSHPVFAQCTFTENTTLGMGGAVYGDADADSAFEHCLFVGNESDRLGGAIANDGATVTMTNCTLSANHATWYGGGVWNGVASSARIADSILWGNTDGSSTPGTEKVQIVRDNADVVANYTCVQDLSATLPGVGNIGLDPLFADPNQGDYHLMSQAGRWDAGRKVWVRDAVTSPCIDAGDPNRPLGEEPSATPLDPTNAWSINRRIDMGFYGGTAEASMAPLP